MRSTFELDCGFLGNNRMHLLLSIWVLIRGEGDNHQSPQELRPLLNPLCVTTTPQPVWLRPPTQSGRSSFPPELGTGKIRLPARILLHIACHSRSLQHGCRLHAQWPVTNLHCFPSKANKSRDSITAGLRLSQTPQDRLNWKSIAHWNTFAAGQRTTPIWLDTHHIRARQHGINFARQSNEHCLARQPRAIGTRL
jgi:hypothetical protein